MAALTAANEAAPPVVPADVIPLDPARFTGTADDLVAENITVQFANGSRPNVPRLDITITDVPLDLFTIPAAFAVGETPGCGAAGDLSVVCVGDEVAVDRFTATFSDSAGTEIRTFGLDTVQIVSQELFGADGVTAQVDANGVPQVSQIVTWVLFSIRFDDVAPLVPGMSTVVVELDKGTAAAVTLGSAVLLGDSAINDAQNVSVTALNGVLNAEVPVGAFITPAGSTVSPTPGASFAATGVVSNRGRIRITGTCNAGNASAPGLDCRTDADGSFSCRGRSLTAGAHIGVSCSGGSGTAPTAGAGAVAPATTPAVAASGTADDRGRILLSGTCAPGQEASLEGEVCRSRRDGSFRCRRSDLAPRAAVSVVCN